jgi:hypothetical protein
LRIRKPAGVLFLEFDGDRFYRYILFTRGKKLPSLENLKKSYLDEELVNLHQREVISLHGKSLPEDS